MKKLFAIAVAAGLLTGLYGASIGLGGQYTINEPRGYMDTVNISYPSVVVDLWVPLIPVLTARMGLVKYNFIGDDDGGKTWAFGTGVYGGLNFMIPTQMMFKPYIPINITYGGTDAGSTMHLMGGIGGVANFGTVYGYLEGGVSFVNWSVTDMDSDNGTSFYVQGGIRVPFGM